MKYKKIKICFFTTDFPPTVGGISEASRSLAYHMAEYSEVDHVQVIALKNKIEGIEKPIKKLTIVRNRSKSFIAMFLNVLKYTVKFRDYGVFHATSVFPIGFLAVILGKYILRKKVFVTFYGTDILSPFGKNITRWAKVWTLKHASRAIAFSYSTRDQAASKHKIPLEQFKVVYYPLPDLPPDISADTTQFLKKKYGILQDDFVVLFVGHLVRRKGPEDLVEALSKIDDQHVKLLIVGKGPIENDLKAQVSRYGLEARVIFAGEQDAKPYYSLACVFSMPSFFYKKEGDIEGLGIVYLEAQQYGIPVLGTKSGGIPEAIEDGGSGFLVAERDIEGLAQKIKLLANDKELAIKMGNRGRQFVAEKFDWRKSVKVHLGVYNS